MSGTLIILGVGLCMVAVCGWLFLRTRPSWIHVVVVLAMPAPWILLGFWARANRGLVDYAGPMLNYLGPLSIVAIAIISFFAIDWAEQSRWAVGVLAGLNMICALSTWLGAIMLVANSWI